MVIQSPATRSPFILLEDDTGILRSETMGGRSLSLEQFLQDTSTQREIDSNLLVWFFCTPSPPLLWNLAFPDSRRGHQVLELTVELGAGFAEPSSEGGSMGPHEECLNREFQQHPNHSGLEYMSNQTSDVSGSASAAIFEPWYAWTQRDEEAALNKRSAAS